MPHASAGRLISADSHVAVKLDAIRARLPQALRAPFDAALAEQARLDEENRGGRKLERNAWDMEAMRDPGYGDPAARLAAMDRDGVEAEVLYADVNTFQGFRLVRD